MTTVTIKFRAKRDEFAGGMGYKVPALTGNHVTFSDRDTTAVLLSTSKDMTTAFQRYGLKIPGVVWETNSPSEWRSDTSAWTIKPIGKGFMADVSIEWELIRA